MTPSRADTDLVKRFNIIATADSNVHSMMARRLLHGRLRPSACQSFWSPIDRAGMFGSPVAGTAGSRPVKHTRGDIRADLRRLDRDER